MLRPFLLIGVGGSGGKTLRIVRDTLEKRLQQAGWDGPFPAGWQFMHVDVPSSADGNDPDLPGQLPDADYVGLVSAGLTYKTIDGALAGNASTRTELGDSMGGWRPDPTKVNVPVEKGAGQFRALGRLITVAKLKDVKTGIDDSVRRMTGAEVAGELSAVSRLLEGKSGTSQIQPPVAIVVSSIAGGSGAGAVIDVCDALRSTGATWASESFGILYAPDVFDYLPEQRRRGVRPNALATLSELVAGFWNKQGPTEATQQLLGKQGVTTGEADRLGPRYSFLVGARNEFVSYATQNDVYRSMGRSLASWVSSPVLQDRIEAYIQGNWQAAAAAVPDNLPLKSNDLETPFTALGSARVGMGRDRFRQYTSERLARAAVETVLRRHREDLSRDDDRTEAAIVQDQAKRLLVRFLSEVRLNERSEEFNDILDSLRSLEQHKADLKALTAEIVDAVATNAPEKGRNVADWRSLVLKRINDRRGSFLDQCDMQHRDRARQWVGDIQDRLVATVATYVAIEGAPVTRAILQDVESELRFVKTELEQEALKNRRNAADVGQNVDHAWSSAGGELLKAGHPSLREAVARGVQTLGWLSEASLREMTIELIPDLTNNVIVPLREALTRSMNELAREEVSDGGSPSATAHWPQGDIVPSLYRAAPNEFLIDSSDDYPQMFEQVLRRTLSKDSAGANMREAQLQVITGADDDTPQKLISQNQRWNPELSNLHVNPTETATRARFDFGLGAADLLARADGWIIRPGTFVARFVQEGLRDYLDTEKADPEDLSRRLSRFEAQLGAALDATRPLVNINKAVLVQVHDRNEIPSEVFPTEIPFPATSEARDIVKKVFEARGLWSAQIEQSVTEAPVGHIDLFSVLSEPYESVVFDSLMRPIAEEWAVRSKSPDLRQEFWRWRRARPLPEFIPVAPAIRKSMVRGWFTATLLNQVMMDDNRVEIFVNSATGGTGRVYPFPEPLLVDNIAAQHQYLPAVLQSLPLALVDVSVQADLGPITPYRQLRELGASADGGWDVYRMPSKALSDWIHKGTVAAGAPTPDPATAGSVDDSWNQRQEMVAQRFERLREMYITKLFAEVERRDDAFDVPLAYELREDITVAFEDLIRAVRHIEPPATEASAWN